MLVLVGQATAERLAAGELTPEAVDDVQRLIGRGRGVGQGQSDVVDQWDRLGNGRNGIFGNRSSIIELRDEMTIFEATQRVSPRLGEAVHQPSVEPGGDLVELHARHVGQVARVEVVAVAQEQDLVVGMTIGNPLTFSANWNGVSNPPLINLSLR